MSVGPRRKRKDSWPKYAVFHRGRPLGKVPDGNTVCVSIPRRFAVRFRCHCGGPIDTGLLDNIRDHRAILTSPGRSWRPCGVADSAIIVCSAKFGHERGRRKGVEIQPARSCPASSISPRPTRELDYNSPSRPAGPHRQERGPRVATIWDGTEGDRQHRQLNKRAYDIEGASAMRFPSREQEGRGGGSYTALVGR
jgi:hypothetical protein